MSESTNEVVESVTDETVHDITDLPPEQQEQRQPTPAEIRQMIRANRNMLRSVGFDLNKTYYISGPMSGYADHNYAEFERVAMMLRQCGLDVESPHENEWPENHENMSEKVLWKAMMEKAMKQIEGCNGIILLRGWPQSKGAKKELLYALRRDWPVWFFDEETIFNMNARVEMEADEDAAPPTESE